MQSQLAEINKYPGLNKVFVAQHANLHNPYTKAIAFISSQVIKEGGYTSVVAAATGFGKDLMPRVGGLLDLQAITDVVEIKADGTKFVRPVYAGNALATVSTIDKVRLLTVRPTNFDKVSQGDSDNSYPT